MACAPYSGCLSVWQQAGNRQATNKPNYSRAEQEAVVSLLDWCQAALLAAIACCMPLALRHGPANVTPLAWASACARDWDWDWAREALRFWHLAIYMVSLQFGRPLPLSLSLYFLFLLYCFLMRVAQKFLPRAFFGKVSNRTSWHDSREGAAKSCSGQLQLKAYSAFKK